MPPNIQLNRKEEYSKLHKNFYRKNKSSSLEKKCRIDYKDKSGLQLINFDFTTKMKQESKSITEF